jgi:hypothetical protein
MADGDRKIEPLVLHPQFIEVTKCLPREIADLRVVAFRFELGDHDHRQDHGMFGEAEDGLRVRQQHRGVEHIGALGRSGLRI